VLDHAPEKPARGPISAAADGFAPKRPEDEVSVEVGAQGPPVYPEDPEKKEIDFATPFGLGIP